MPFLLKIPLVLLFLNCFRAKQIGFEQVFDYLSFKHMDTLMKQIQSLVEPLFLDIGNVYRNSQPALLYQLWFRLLLVSATMWQQYVDLIPTALRL